MSVGEFSTSFSNHFSFGTLLSTSINSSLGPSTSWSLHRKNVTRAKAEMSWIIIVRAASIILLMMDTFQAGSWEMGIGSYVHVHVSVHVYVWLQLVFSPVCVCVRCLLYLRMVSWVWPPARWHWMQPFVAFALQQWLPWGSGRILVLLPSELLVVASSATRFKRSGEKANGRKNGGMDRGGKAAEITGAEHVYTHICLLGPLLVLGQSCPFETLCSCCCWYGHWQ